MELGAQVWEWKVNRHQPAQFAGGGEEKGYGRGGNGFLSDLSGIFVSVLWCSAFIEKERRRTARAKQGTQPETHQ